MSEAAAIEARRAYDEYFRMCVNHPDLCSYENARRVLKIPKPSRLWESYEVDATRYTWFVAYALKVFDDLLTYDDPKSWKKPLRFQLEMHGPALAAIWPANWSGLYSGELGVLVDEVIEGVR